jgi:hypothetical protein
VKLSSANVLGLGQMKSILFPQFKSNPLNGWRGVVLNNSPTSNDSFAGQNIEPEAIYKIKSTNIPLSNIPCSRWVSSLNPTYAISDRTGVIGEIGDIALTILKIKQGLIF